MNLTQYNRWKDFALRMARVIYAESVQPTSGWIVEKVEHYFSDLEMCQGLEVLELTTAWDQAGKDGFHPCDYMAEKEYDLMPQWMLFTYNETENEIKAFEAECRERFDEVFFAPVRCCVRAGIDLACDPSAGVLGFTIGCIRKMYPEGVPDWIEGQVFKWSNSGEWQAGVFKDAPDEADVLL
jgi:hypothetical protein